MNINKFLDGKIKYIILVALVIAVLLISGIFGGKPSSPNTEPSTSAPTSRPSQNNAGDQAPTQTPEPTETAAGPGDLDKMPYGTNTLSWEDTAKEFAKAYFTRTSEDDQTWVENTKKFAAQGLVENLDSTSYGFPESSQLVNAGAIKVTDIQIIESSQKRLPDSKDQMYTPPLRLSLETEKMGNIKYICFPTVIKDNSGGKTFWFVQRFQDGGVVREDDHKHE